MLHINGCLCSPSLQRQLMQPAQPSRAAAMKPPSSAGVSRSSRAGNPTWKVWFLNRYDSGNLDSSDTDAFPSWGR